MSNVKGGYFKILLALSIRVSICSLIDYWVM